MPARPLGEATAAESSSISPCFRRTLTAAQPILGQQCAAVDRSSFATKAVSTGAAAAAVAVSATPAMEVVRVPALSDNYVWLLHEPKSNLTAVVDPAELEPVNRVLKER